MGGRRPYIASADMDVVSDVSEVVAPANQVADILYFGRSSKLQNQLFERLR